MTTMQGKHVHVGMPLWGMPLAHCVLVDWHLLDKEFRMT